MNQLTIHEEGELIEVASNSSLNDLLGAAKEQFALAFGAHRKTVEHVWRMGKFLTEALEKHRVLKGKKGKGQPNWDELLDQFGISVATDNRARRLYKNGPTLEQLEGLTVMQAYEAAGIPKTATKQIAATNPTSNDLDEDADDSSEPTEEEVADEVVGPSDEDRPYVQRLKDVESEMSLLWNAFQKEQLSKKQIKVVLNVAEQIAQHALDLKMALEE